MASVGIYKRDKQNILKKKRINCVIYLNRECKVNKQAPTIYQDFAKTLVLFSDFNHFSWLASCWEDSWEKVPPILSREHRLCTNFFTIKLRQKNYHNYVISEIPRNYNILLMPEVSYYRTRAIITRGLYTFYPLFEVHLCTVTFGLMYG